MVNFWIGRRSRLGAPTLVLAAILIGASLGSIVRRRRRVAVRKDGTAKGAHQRAQVACKLARYEELEMVGHRRVRCVQ